MDLLESLNQRQREIITSDSKIIMIVAGPGTGKTKVLTTKVAYLVLKELIDPKTILTLTFTQKAVSEMEERLRVLLSKADLPLITTIHGFCFNQLNNFQNIKIIPDNQRQKLLKQVIAQSGTKISVKDLSLILSQTKNLNNLNFSESIKTLINNYQKQLKKLGLLDYDDLMINLLNLVQSDKNLLLALQKQYQIILVDEFQDLSPIQYQIIRQLIGQNSKLFVIGDPLQSIYSFRGANSEVFNLLKNDFPGLYQANLTINYRSFSKIVTLSNSLFKESVNLSSFYQDSGEVGIVETFNQTSEANWIIKFIIQKMGGIDLNNAYQINDDIKFSDFGVLFRTHYLSQTLEREFIRSGIPFKLGGEVSIFKQPEVEFLCLILQFLFNKTESTCNEILNSSYLDLPLDTIPVFSLENLTKNKAPSKDLNKELMGKYNQLIKSINLSEGILPSDLVDRLLSIWGIKSDPKDLVSPINQFLALLVQFENSLQPLKELIEYINNLKSHDYFDFQTDKVSLLTIHSAKGLEFKYLFIVGFEDGIIPLEKEGEFSDLEEEKRLFYVAMTRAKEGMYLIHCQKRYGKFTRISPFVDFLNLDEVIQVTDEMIEKIIKKQVKIKLKKSQLTFF